MNPTRQDIQNAARACLVKAGTTYRPDQFRAYEKALERESGENSRWVLERILENARIAEKEQLPLCDDTGIPHVIVHVGEKCMMPRGWLSAIEDGIREGLEQMPGRPMAVLGNDVERVEQSGGLDPAPGALEPAPVIVRPDKGDRLKITVLLLGGGPEIRAKTRRIFHRHSMDHVLDEVIRWLAEEAGSLGCTPGVAAVGIGRTQMEASSLMVQAMAEGDLDHQSPLENRITRGVNASKVGPLGLGGDTTFLGSFLKIGPARASGVRIVCARPCCIVEPRRASKTLG